MKKILYLILVVSCYLRHTNAQTDSVLVKNKPKGIFKIYPQQALGGEIRVGYEIPLAKRFGLEISPGYIFGLWQGEIDGYIDPDDMGSFPLFQGIALRLGLRFYTSSKKSHAGFYINPLLLYKYAYLHETSDLGATLTRNAYILAGQCLFGYKFLTPSTIIFEVYGGIGYKKAIETYDHHDPSRYDNKETQIAFTPTLQLGFLIGFRSIKKIKR